MFDAARGVSSKKRKLGPSAILAIAAHALVIGALVTVRHGGGQAEPQGNPEITFFTGAPPPPPPPPAAATPKPQTPKTSKRIVASVKIQTPSPTAEPVTPETPSEPETPPAEPGGVPGGQPGGIPGGTVGGVDGGVLGNPLGGGAKVVPSFVIDRERLSAPDPVLPDDVASRFAGQAARGTYRICVDMAGNVSSVETVSAIAGADDTIINHLKSTWKYKPQPVPICTVRKFVFNIR